MVCLNGTACANVCQPGPALPVCQAPPAARLSGWRSEAATARSSLGQGSPSTLLSPGPLSLPAPLMYLRGSVGLSGITGVFSAQSQPERQVAESGLKFHQELAQEALWSRGSEASLGGCRGQARPLWRVGESQTSAPDARRRAAQDRRRWLSRHGPHPHPVAWQPPVPGCQLW